MTAPTGVIHSPNYPNHYEKNTICEWSISVEDNYAVVLTFEDVDMYRNNCSDNYIKVGLFRAICRKSLSVFRFLMGLQQLIQFCK